MDKTVEKSNIDHLSYKISTLQKVWKALINRTAKDLSKVPSSITWFIKLRC